MPTIGASYNLKYSRLIPEERWNLLRKVSLIQQNK